MLGVCGNKNLVFKVWSVLRRGVLETKLDSCHNFPRGYDEKVLISHTCAILFHFYFGLSTVFQ